MVNKINHGETDMPDRGQTGAERAVLSPQDSDLKGISRRSVAAGLALTPFVASVVRAAPNPTDPSLLNGAQLISAYHERSLSPTDVITAVYKRISDVGSMVNAFVLTDQAGAMRQAEASAARWKNANPLGPLDGLPVTVKDNIPVAGYPARKGSRAASEAPVAESAPAAARLISGGAIVLGKTCMPEFGWKGVGDSPLTGITRNPWNTSVTTGGSTAGGSAAAALNLGVIHIGTDGAGSLRIPSSFCGVFGLKPSYGRIPTVPAGPTLHIGSVSRSVRDSAALLQTLAGYDPQDLTSTNVPIGNLLDSLDSGVKGMRIAWSPRLGYVDNLDPEVEAVTTTAARSFAAMGAAVEQVDPGFGNPMPILEPIWLTICWMIARGTPESRWNELDPGLLVLAMKGRNVSAADYATAIGARAGLHAKMARFNERYDLLLTPTLATPAFEVGHNTPPNGKFGDDWLNWAPYTYPFNLSYHPAASVPCGFTADGRPIGLQIIGPYMREELVLRAAHAFEQAHPWPFTEVPKPA
jgi:aspartyl-tRNA(Asn)/glutamyl-tRNA(Gln) amidotransferase subunit A